jgi:hypothetical protein
MLSVVAGVTGAAAVAGIGVLSSVGSGVLGEVLTSVVNRLRSSSAEQVLSQEEFERGIARRIQEILATEDSQASALRSEIAAILEEIDAGGTALRATIEAGNEELRREVIAAVGELSSDFAEMEFLLADVARAAVAIQESLSGQEAQLRSISGQVGRQSTDVRMIREELAVIEQRTRPYVLAEAREKDSPLSWANGCPYRGLLPFDEAHEAVFYGRERLTSDLVGKLEGAGLLIVTGASGAGKTSLLRAGLLPALARGLQLPGSSSWPRLVITPTAHPLAELATQLAVLGGRDGAIVRRALVNDPGEAHLTVREIVMAACAQRDDASRVSSSNTERLVLIVDQFERIFDTASGDDLEQERRAFINALYSAAKNPAGPRSEPPALVVVAVRGDFWDRCAAYPGLVRALQESQFVVGPMTESELRRAITGPAEASGLHVETALTDTILSDLHSADSGHATGVLPLLSQAMMLTWENRDGNELTSRGYGKTGGVNHAVQASADAIYDALPENQKAIAREVLRRMTAVSSDRRLARRLVTRDDLHAGRPGNEWSQIDAVLEVFASKRLLVLNADTAEIAHDALLQAWPRLRGWLEEDQASLILHGQLTEDATEWRKSGEDSSFLYRGTQLAALQQATTAWAADSSRYPALTSTEAEFLKASNLVATRNSRQRRILAAVLALLLVAAVTGAGIALAAAKSAGRQRNIAEQQRSVAISGRLGAQSAALDAADPVTASLLAAAAWRIAPTEQARYSLLEALAQPGRGVFGARAGVVTSVAFSPDGRYLAAGYQDGTVRLWSLASHHLIHSSTASPGDAVIALAFGGSGKILEADAVGLVSVWNIEGFSKIATPARTGPEDVSDAVFSRDGRTLATGYYDGTARLWDVVTRQQIGAPIATGARPGATVALSPSGKVLATSGAGGTARLLRQL